MTKYNEFEIQWIADNIRGILLGTNGTDRFPEEFYIEAKKMVGWKDEQQ